MPSGVYERCYRQISERLFQRVVKTDSCWLWQGAKSKFGHGQLMNGAHNQTLHKRSLLTAHRVSYELLVGPIPEGLFVLHDCDQPDCVNPDHLFLGTKAENSKDMVAKGRQARGVDLPQAKLCEEDVRAIRLSAKPQAQIAKDFGIAQSCVSLIRRRLQWAHVD